MDSREQTSQLVAIHSAAILLWTIGHVSEASTPAVCVGSQIMSPYLLVVPAALGVFGLYLNKVQLKYFTMKMRRATVSQPVPFSREKICQKDQIKRASGLYYQCDGDQLDVAGSSEEDEGLQFKIGIPGCRTIFGKKNHPLRRIFWICLTIVCGFLAFYQVKGCIVKYESENVIKEVQIINNETLIFPSVTLCNTWNLTFNPSAMEAMRFNEKIQMPSDLLSLVNVTAAWNGIGHSDLKEIELVCWFGRNKSCEASGYWEILHTVVGPCYSFRVLQPVRETGLFNGLYIKIEAKPPFDNWIYYIHPHNVTPALNIYEIRNASNDFLGMGKFNTDVKINYHQAQSLNVRRDPCVEEAEYTAELCELECFSEQLVRHAGCRLPFMKLSNTSPSRNRPNCNTTETYRAAGKELKRMLLSDGTTWNRTGCNCIMSCFRTYYHTDKEKVMADAKPGRFRFRVFFQTRTYEARTQKLEYGLINLFCAIGNSIGLLLGMSVLTLCEALEWGAFRLFHWLKSSTDFAGQQRRIHPRPSLAVD